MSTFVPLLQHVVGPAPVDLDAPRSEPDREPEPPRDPEAERQASFELGRQAGAAERDPEILALRAQVEVLPELLDGLARARRAALAQASADVAQIVVEVTRKVLGDTMLLHPDALAGLVQRAIDRLPEEDEVWIRVPPAAVDRVVATVPERHRDRVRPDPALTTGCVVETRHVAIDASLEAAMDAIHQAAQAWVAGRS
jgi:flagellar biosynthesis/type III secretory pathway protein FliH